MIAMPPYVHRPDFDTIFAYYQAISDAVEHPGVDPERRRGGPIARTRSCTLCTEIEHVSWVKEEVPPSTHSIGALVARKCPAIEGVMGGAAGRHMITERARGSKGVINACQFCDVVQRVWDLLEADQGGRGEGSLRASAAGPGAGGPDGHGLRQGDHGPPRRASSNHRVRMRTRIRWTRTTCARSTASGSASSPI